MPIKEFSKSKLIAIHALLTAIMMLFIFVPITIGVLQLAFIPIIAVIISALILGWKHGALSGAIFGVISFVSAFVQPTILSLAFYNPLVSIVPRILIGITVYFSALAIKKIVPKCPDIVRYAVASAVGVLTNTTLVLGMILLFHFGTDFSGLVIGWEWIVATISGNFIIEIIVCTIVTPSIVMALKKVVK
ncbi:MAG: ECF transporter S component [Bacillota bacterium]